MTKWVLAGLTALMMVMGTILPTKADAAEPPIAGTVRHFTLADQVYQAPMAPFYLDGKEITLADYAGKVVVLNFWATWCAPCVKEMPSFDRLNQALDQNKATVLTVSTDRNAGKVPGFLKNRLGVKTLPAATAPNRGLANAFSVRGLPSTFIIGADGIVKGVLNGPAEWDEPAAKELVAFFINEAAS